MTIQLPDTFPELLSLLIQIGTLFLILILIFVGARVFSLLGILKDIAETLSDITQTVNLILYQPIRIFSLLSDKLGMFFKKKR
ncbi:hypothetical protein IPN35_01630 [Candidatus Peregrinibacteria bacterium]|nr:MAG: hypothetical protein IPN35_01630 [Candidatus Peregrinibacteria bacterium]